MRFTPLWLVLASTVASADELSIPHERYQLDNGLEVILAPDRSNPIVHTQLWFHVGSKDEVMGRTGFAHLFEHLMFQGSANAPGEYFTPLQAIGASINGTTNADRTNYFETVPSQFLPLALFMESDRMGTLLEVLTVDKLDNQREVVRNERRQRYENPPYGEAWSDLYASLYPTGHPYNHTTIGSHEDLEAATLDDVKAFFRTWYVPNNASLVVVGDFDADVAKGLIEEQFGWMPRGTEPVHAEVAPAPLPETVIVRQEDDVPDAKLWMAWQTPEFFAKGDAALDIASSLLCDGKDSRLYKALVKDRGLARDISCFQASRKLGSAFVVMATAADGHTTDEIATAVQDIFGVVAESDPPTKAELDAAIVNFEVNFFNRVRTISGKGGLLSSYLYFTGETDYLSEDLARYRRLSPAMVQSTIGTWLTGPHAQLHILPAPEEAE